MKSDSFEMVPTLQRIPTTMLVMKKFFYAGCWPLKERSQAEENMDISSKDGSKLVQPNRGFG